MEVVGLGKQPLQLHFQCRQRILLFVLMILFSSSFSHGNGDGDLPVLLAFKLSCDSSNSLISWSNATASTFCNAWVGITCHAATRRVSKVVLDNLNLTGSFEVLSQLRHLRHLSLHHNRLSTTPNFTTWPNLKHLYLSHNHFTGKFPPGISALRNLRRLDLSYNDFSGVIPVTELIRLTHLLTLRLESNWFNGTLGSDKIALKSLSSFNVSNNGLAGKIPTWLSRFPASSFAGNSRLCGKPLLSDCSAKPSTVNPHALGGPLPIGVTDVKKKKSSNNASTVLMIALIDVIGVLVILLFVALCYYRKYRKHKALTQKQENGRKGTSGPTAISARRDREEEIVCFDGCRGFTRVDELLKASAEMLGKGSVGTTYRVALGRGEVVVVKRVREKVWKVKDVNGFLGQIGGLRHPNILSLRAYYSSEEELLLVYDHLHNGSLHNLLHGNRGPGRLPLDWPWRLKIALGSAGGLAFLHSCSKSKLYHGHLTSSNIVIDDNGNPCISNIGLHQLLQLQYSSSNDVYKAPELMQSHSASHSSHSRKQSQKCDVYSFGVVLLEILTGKMATGEGDTSLVKGVQQVLAHEEWTWDVFDFELARYKEMQEEMVALLQVAILCLDSSPIARPKMSVVHEMIEDIITKREEEGSGPSIY